MEKQANASYKNGKIICTFPTALQMLIHCVYSRSAAPLHMHVMTSLTSALVAITEMSDKRTLSECHWQDQNATALSDTTSSFPRLGKAVSVYNKNTVCL